MRLLTLPYHPIDAESLHADFQDRLGARYISFDHSGDGLLLRLTDDSTDGDILIAQNAYEASAPDVQTLMSDLTRAHAPHRRG